MAVVTLNKTNPCLCIPLGKGPENSLSLSDGTVKSPLLSSSLLFSSLFSLAP